MGNGRSGVGVREEDLTTIVCVGVTGAGKSTLCNVLVGRPFATVAEGFKSGTTEPVHYDCIQRGVPLRVVDTVGFLSNQTVQEQNLQWWSASAAAAEAGEPAAEHTEQQTRATGSAKEEKKFDELTPVSIFGVNVFLFLERYGRFTNESSRHFKVFADLVGPEALKRTIFVFTHVPHEKLSQALDAGDLPAGLNDIRTQVHAMIGVESCGAARRAISTVLQEVQSTVKANNGQRYLSEDLMKIQQKRKDLEERIRRLKRVDRREMLNRQRLELVNGGRTYGEFLQAIEDAEAAEGLRPRWRSSGTPGCFCLALPSSCLWGRWPWPR